MPTEMKEKYPFSVDSWTSLSRRKRHHFLTHAHSDHTGGIESFAHRPIYCSDMTRRLLLRRFCKLDASRFIILEIGEARLVPDEEQSFTVTALDANHCPGAVMLLFEGNFGNVLHTGDCRLTEDCLTNMLGRYRAQQRVLDCVFLDCTFGRERLKMPSKNEAFLQVQQCILNHPQAPIVYLACDLLGQEELLGDLVECFRTKIFVDKKALPEYFADLMIVAPDLITEDPQSTRFHICGGFPKLADRAKVKFMQARRLGQPDPLFIRPSTQFYTFGETLEGAGCGMILDAALKQSAGGHRTLKVPKAACKDDDGIWHVCYSIHSSRSELERAMDILWPKEVISTTPNCHAREVTSKRAGLHHVDMRTADEVLKGSIDEGKSRRDSAAKCAVKGNRAVLSSPTSVRARKKACLDDTPNKDCHLDALPYVVPLFGMARHTIPLSPPLSFASTDSQPDLDLLDTQSTLEYFSDGYKASLEVREEPLSPVNCATLSPLENLHFLENVVAPSLERIEETSNIVSRPNTGQMKPSSQADGEAKELDDFNDKENIDGSMAISDSVPLSLERKNQIGGVDFFKETTRNLFTSLRAPIPAPLPSLMDLYYLA